MIHSSDASYAAPPSLSNAVRTGVDLAFRTLAGLNLDVDLDVELSIYPDICYGFNRTTTIDGYTLP